MNQRQSCAVCGGDGRISAGHRGTATCPSCRGSGARPDDLPFHDVTKTKPSHHNPQGAGKKAAKVTWPITHGGMKLAEEVKASNMSEADKARLTRSIIDYEARKGECTKTFSRLIRKELRAAE